MSHRLKHNLDIRTAINILTKLNERGRRVISVQELLCLTVPRIAHKEELMSKLKAYAAKRTDCNCNELSSALGISRQTIYNWQERGYLILNENNRILVLDTYHYWLTKDLENKCYKKTLASKEINH